MEDPAKENIIYVGTDHGVYVSVDGGNNYHAFVSGLTNTPVHDLIVHSRENDLVLGTHGRGIYIGNVSLVQQLTSDILAKTIHAFPIEEITHSTRWGSSWAWRDPYEPTTNVSFYSNSNGNGKIEVIYKNQVVSSKEINADKGLNIIELGLETDESFKDLLDDEQKEDYKAAENGDYHLVVGEYTVRITVGGTNVETPMTIKAPRERPGRKE